MDSQDNFVRNAFIGSVLLVAALFAVVELHPQEQPKVEATAPPLASSVNVVDAPNERLEINREPLLVIPEARVYECAKNGQKVFSDSVCGNDAQARDISPVNRMDRFTPSYRPIRRPPVQIMRADLSAINGPDCLALERQKDLLNARMRRGYSSQEGERLHEEFRLVQAKLNDCIRAK